MMNRRSSIDSLAALFAVAALVGCTGSRLRAAAPDDKLLAGADARIAKHRKADATITVRDAAGKPLAGAEVTVEQTRHALLFGSNIFKWGRLPDEKMEAAYRKHYAELLNYATLPFYWPMYEPQRGKPVHEHTTQVARWWRGTWATRAGCRTTWRRSAASRWPASRTASRTSSG